MPNGDKYRTDEYRTEMSTERKGIPSVSQFFFGLYSVDSDRNDLPIVTCSYTELLRSFCQSQKAVFSGPL